MINQWNLRAVEDLVQREFNMGKIYITGDKHGLFSEVIWQVKSGRIKENDILIVLGDSGLNYFEDWRDEQLKRKLNKLGITFLIVRGNHEARPTGDEVNIETSEYKGKFIVEADYPHILYMIDGEEYLLAKENGKLATALVIGGAYSVDKFYRLRQQELGHADYKWFPDEQLTKEEQDEIYAKIQKCHYDYVLTHTCPYNMRPTDMFLPSIDQSSVDESMEKFLQKVHDSISFNRWYIGHWHTDRCINCFRFMFHDIMLLDSCY